MVPTVLRLALMLVHCLVLSIFQVRLRPGLRIHHSEQPEDPGRAGRPDEGHLLGDGGRGARLLGRHDQAPALPAQASGM